MEEYDDRASNAVKMTWFENNKPLILAIAAFIVTFFILAIIDYFFERRVDTKDFDQFWTSLTPEWWRTGTLIASAIAAAVGAAQSIPLVLRGQKITESNLDLLKKSLKISQEQSLLAIEKEEREKRSEYRKWFLDVCEKIGSGSILGKVGGLLAAEALANQWIKISSDREHDNEVQSCISLICSVIISESEDVDEEKRLELTRVQKIALEILFRNFSHDAAVVGCYKGWNGLIVDLSGWNIGKAGLRIENIELLNGTKWLLNGLTAKACFIDFLNIRLHGSAVFDLSNIGLSECDIKATSLAILNGAVISFPASFSDNDCRLRFENLEIRGGSQVGVAENNDPSLRLSGFSWLSFEDVFIDDGSSLVFGYIKVLEEMSADIQLDRVTVTNNSSITFGETLKFTKDGEISWSKMSFDDNSELSFLYGIHFEESGAIYLPDLSVTNNSRINFGSESKDVCKAISRIKVSLERSLVSDRSVISFYFGSLKQGSRLDFRTTTLSRHSSISLRANFAEGEVLLPTGPEIEVSCRKKTSNEKARFIGNDISEELVVTRFGDLSNSFDLGTN